jgi:hypothetical protein
LLHIFDPIKKTRKKKRNKIEKESKIQEDIHEKILEVAQVGGEGPKWQVKKLEDENV